MLTLLSKMQESDAPGTIERSLGDTLRVMEVKKHSNQDEIERLEEENRFLFSTYMAAFGVLSTGLFIPLFVTQVAGWFAGVISARWILTRAQKVSSLLKVSKALVAAFSDEEIQLFADLPVPEHGNLDLLVKLSALGRKAVFAIALRTQGKTTIAYSPDKDKFYIRRKAGTNPWKPDPFERLGVQGFWLRQNRQEELFGTSRNDRNRPIVKILVITGETKIGQHPDSLYTQIGELRVLLIKRRSSIFMLQEEQLIPFLRAWLASPGQ